MLHYIIVWFVLLAIAIGNGALRQATFAKRMSELHAHQLSTVIGSVVIGAFIWFIIDKWPPSSNREAIAIGVVWLCMTVVFEFFMGLVIKRQPMAEVVSDYNLSAGRVWILFLIWLALAPWLFFALKQPNQALQRNDHGCHALCVRTCRASHGRG